MEYYQELILLKTPDISTYFLWSKLYSQLHLALVEQESPDKTIAIGVSFPEYNYSELEGKLISDLGLKLRLFAPAKAELEQLNLDYWFKRLGDYLRIRDIESIPENISHYLHVKRYRPKLNLETVTRRYAKRKNISIEEARLEQNKRFAEKHSLTLKEAKLHYKKPKAKRYPFIKLESLSGSKSFSLIIQQVRAENRRFGTFSSYGLSSKSTVPHW